MNTNLLKEAIAEADAIKKMAIENAKASLNEAFDSKVKAMLAARLAEESDDLEEEYEEGKDEAAELDEKKHKEEEGDDEGYGMEEAEEDMKPEDEAYGKEEEADEAFDLDAILAELEKGDEEEGQEVMEKKEEDSEEPKEEKHDDEDHEDKEEEMKEAKDDDDKDEEKEDKDESVDEEIDITALLAEMEDGEDDEVKEAKDEDDEAYVGEGEGDKGLLMAALTPILKKMGVSDDVIKKMQDRAQEIANAMANAGVGLTEKKEADQEELEEIKRQAAELAQKVNETNLINAKLLYLNKILRKYNLSEQQKLKVISAFDKASTTKEAKIVHESLDQAFSVKNDNKTGLKESMGFASKAAGTSTKRVITEGVISNPDAQVSRWQKLAGIIK